VPHTKSCEIRLLANFLPQSPRRCRAFSHSTSTACKNLRQAFYLALPLLSARCHIPMPGVVVSSTEPLPRVRYRSVHTSGRKTLRNCRKPAHDRFACTRKCQSRQWLAAFVADAFILPFFLRAACQRPFFAVPAPFHARLRFRENPPVGIAHGLNRLPKPPKVVSRKCNWLAASLPQN
jgi:hypothetical protein